MGDGSGPRGMIFHPTTRVSYVNCELNGTLVVCDIKEDGLHPVQTVACYPEEFKCEGHPKNLGKASNWLAEAAIT